MEAALGQVYTLVGSLAPVLQVVVIVILAIIFWKPIAQKLGWKGGDRSAGEEIVAEVRNITQGFQSSLDYLGQYANHETTEHTEILREIRDGLRANTDMMRTNFQLIHSTHDEWNRRGIPVECKK